MNTITEASVMHRVVLISACRPLAFLLVWRRIRYKGGRRNRLWKRRNYRKKEYDSRFKKRVNSKVNDKTK
jgi:hypothetical protein